MADSNRAELIVPPVPAQPPGAAGLATNDIRGIRPPVEIPNPWAWLSWLLVLLLAAATVLALRHWWQRKAAAAQVVPRIPPHVRARQKLDTALRLIHDPREFCTLVSDTLRVYLEERFDFHAPDRTTEEFLLELRGTPLLTPDQKQSLGEFLESCDLVKFARFEPTESALRELHDAANRLIDETQYDPVEPESHGPPATGAPTAPKSERHPPASSAPEEPETASVSRPPSSL